MRKNFTKLFPFAAASVALASCQTQTESTPNERPNILFVFVDDLGFADVGFNGSTYYETPTIDSVAAQSLIFQNSYTYPTSSPSRTALFTGQQSFRTGVYNVPALEKGSANESIFSRWTVSTDYPFYSEQLAKAGYESIHLGKWHVVGPYPDLENSLEFPLTEPLKQPAAGDYSWVARHKEGDIKMKYYPEGRGFLKNVGGSFKGDPAYEEGGYKSYTGGYRAPLSNPFIEKKDSDEWLTDRLTDDAIEFMQEHKDGPFFVNLHYYTVHRPVVSRSDELLEKYMNKEGDEKLGQGVGEGKRKEDIAAYATMVESLDDNFGKLVNFLKDNGLDKNTIIVFSSDNGYNVGGNNLLRSKKRSIYEGGVRVPTFVHWPEHVNARRTDVPIHILDYFPTFLDMAGINNYNGILDGKSLTPLFMGDTPELKERPIFWQLNSVGLDGTCTAMRQGKYKLIQFLATGNVELYDLEADPKETTNIATDRADVAEKMLSEMKQWRATNNVPLPPNAIVDNK
ncbi:MAG: sulfatase [Rikenellaceae bacterium]